MRGSFRSPGLDSGSSYRSTAIRQAVSESGRRRGCIWVRSLAWAVVLLSAGTLAARDGPRPPCGVAPIPAYPDLGARPAVQALTDANLGKGWMPPSCTGWMSPGAKVRVALAASFRDEGTVDDLVGRFGAITRLRGIQYWSVSDNAWRPLVTDAAAVNGPDDRRRRPDFTAREMTRGTDLYFVQRDSRSSGEVLYRMRVREKSSDQLVVEIENASPIRLLLLTLFGPGDLQFVYWVERRVPGVWGYYNLSRTGEATSRLAGGHERSYVNRAVALYRQFVGIPTDQQPPAAP